MGSQKPLSVTSKLPRLLAHFTHAQRPPHSGFVLTAYPSTTFEIRGFAQSQGSAKTQLPDS
jgi:hypothetical protein